MTNKTEDYTTLRKIVAYAQQEMHNHLMHFTLDSWKTEQKSDGSIVTILEKQVDKVVTTFVRGLGFSVVSEEGEEDDQALRSGNYVLIDINDGSGSLDHCVRESLQKGNLKRYYTDNLKNHSFDHGLLITIVENGLPQQAAVLNYRTGSCVFVDSRYKQYHEEQLHLPRETSSRRILDPALLQHLGKHIYYNKSTAGKHPLSTEFERRMTNEPTNYRKITQGAIGFRGLLVQLSNSVSAFTIGRNTSIWDIGPTCVAAQISGGTVLDFNGNPISFTQYFQLPGNGVITYRENEQSWIREYLNTRRD